MNMSCHETIGLFIGIIIFLIILFIETVSKKFFMMYRFGEVVAFI